MNFICIIDFEKAVRFLHHLLNENPLHHHPVTNQDAKKDERQCIKAHIIFLVLLEKELHRNMVERDTESFYKLAQCTSPAANVLPRELLLRGLNATRSHSNSFEEQKSMHTSN
jgi:hypothetical protein